MPVTTSLFPTFECSNKAKANKLKMAQSSKNWACTSSSLAIVGPTSFDVFLRRSTFFASFDVRSPPLNKLKPDAASSLFEFERSRDLKALKRFHLSRGPYYKTAYNCKLRH